MGKKEYTLNCSAEKRREVKGLVNWKVRLSTDYSSLLLATDLIDGN